MASPGLILSREKKKDHRHGPLLNHHLSLTSPLPPLLFSSQPLLYSLYSQRAPPWVVLTSHAHRTYSGPTLACTQLFTFSRPVFLWDRLSPPVLYYLEGFALVELSLALKAR